MKSHRTGITLFALLLTALIFTSCGSAPTRQLVSISVTPGVDTVTNPNLAAHFVATGTYNAPPLTVTPLTAVWTGSFNVIPQYCIAGQGCAGTDPSTGTTLCFGKESGITITATAPEDPSLPVNSKNVATVSGTATLNCP